MIERASDIAAAGRIELLADLLDHAAPPWRPGVLPPLGHWLLFPPRARQSAIGEDGHPRRTADSVIPASDLPRRMWAGSRIRFLADIPLGTTVTRETTLASTTEKAGRSGRMLFVQLAHRLFMGGAPAIEEHQDLVYREAPAADAAARPPAPETAIPIPSDSRETEADPVRLFRFSALTHNAHRIHYDRAYATGTERYPGLVVHGPYLATLLMDQFLRARPAAAVTGFTFRAMRPIFDGDRFTLASAPTAIGADLAVIDAAGGLAMTAAVEAQPKGG